jgi:hypothetical protein
VVEQQEEIARLLQRQLDGRSAVEITGPGKHPTFARAHFLDDGGCWGSLWKAAFPDNQKQVVPCSLQEPLGVEVWIGGALRKALSFLDDPDEVFLDDSDERPGVDGKEVSLFFGKPWVWFEFIMNDWPNWEENVEGARNDPRAVFQDIASSCPGAQVSFLDFNPCVANTTGLVPLERIARFGGSC